MAVAPIMSLVLKGQKPFLLGGISPPSKKVFLCVLCVSAVNQLAAIQPPSTNRVCPVTKSEAGLAR